MIVTKQTKGLNDAKELNSGSEYEKINVLSWHPRDTDYYELSPYYLRTDGNEKNTCKSGVLFENYYQASKVYPFVSDIEVYSHHSQKGNPNALWWKYICLNNKGKDITFDDKTNSLTNTYFHWRDSLWNCQKPIRYPVGITDRKNCLFSVGFVKNDETGIIEEKRYNYLESRKNIYKDEYLRLIRKLKCYQKLLEKLLNGAKIMITEVDLPHSSKKGNYSKTVDSNNIYTPSLESLEVLLNDPSEAFGHGLCLAYGLLEDLAKLKN
jgi:hypothetical protein